MTGNIHSFDDKYDGMVYYPTEMGVQLSNFRLSENDVFDIVQISILPDSTINIAMFTNDSKYYENPETYFGKETIYSQVEDLFHKKGITLRHPFTYIFRNFIPPVIIRSQLAVTGYYVNLTFGDFVLKKHNFEGPFKKL